mgnify:CR=1 FL=1
MEKTCTQCWKKFEGDWRNFMCPRCTAEAQARIDKEKIALGAIRASQPCCPNCGNKPVWKNLTEGWGYVCQCWKNSEGGILGSEKEI